MYLIYNIVACLAPVLLLPWLGYRALRGRMPGLGQRLGFLPENNFDPTRPVVWLHAVSFGEVKAAAPLIEALKHRNPQIQFAITSSTRTGWNAARELLPPDAVFFPPLDFRWVCRRFLRRLRPTALLVMETELWPNLFREAKRFGAALFLVNGRISDQAFPRYRASRFLWRKVLAEPDILFAQSARDAERLLTLGAPPGRVHVAANLKFAVRPPSLPFVESLQGSLKKSGAGPVIVAGSTMSGEEKFLLLAFLQLLPEFPSLCLILAPRHPERFDTVAEEVRAAGIHLERRSNWQPGQSISPPCVVLLDSMGELGSVYQLATVVFVGGTLVPTGGHNILEPAAFSRPIVIGPSMNNFQEIAEAFLEDVGTPQIPGGLAIRTGAVVQVTDAEWMITAFRYLLGNPTFSQQLGEAAHGALNRRFMGVGAIIQAVEQSLARKEVSSPTSKTAVRSQAAIGAR